MHENRVVGVGYTLTKSKIAGLGIRLPTILLYDANILSIYVEVFYVSCGRYVGA